MFFVKIDLSDQSFFPVASSTQAAFVKIERILACQL